MNDYVKAVMTIVSFKEIQIDLFVPIKEVTLDSNNRINLAIYLMICSKTNFNKKLRLVIIQFKLKNNNSMVVSKYAMLKEIKIEECKRMNSTSNIVYMPELAGCRRDIKMLLRGIPVPGEGDYVLLLTDHNEQTIQNDIDRVMRDNLDCYAFKVVK